ncbi:nucleoside triphosphate pyrophosphohydrolase [Thalassospira sp.]|uniref:nucleoside triphosphate pyrophosphohydrolase n=1 Tax=Thalassospira sp. TaxID=1912094 RepID=UPI002732E0C2|nr:nucleoside triphosphate pyrophosphohydrolase [Thalassospira sp.]MDP2698700.1 nucleoside triphosphate pyrophosphohydrolase [Thalassospira sp.]
MITSYPEEIIKDLAPEISGGSFSFSTFQNVSKIFGAKAAGLILLPSTWVPTFIVVPVSFYEKWKEKPNCLSDLVNEIFEWAEKSNIPKVIIRSSGRNETIADRGKYTSIEVGDAKDIKQLEDVIAEVYQRAESVDKTDALGLIVQQYVRPSLIGHLSNEVRHSPTRNQWKYEIEHPWAPTKGLNSKFSPLPDPKEKLASGSSVPHQLLRAVGNWVCSNVAPRCHLEWVCSDGILWLVQLDMEWKELDNGIDPSTDLAVTSDFVPELENTSFLRKYEIGSHTKWKKLKNLSEFDFEEQHSQPIIFQLSGTDVVQTSGDQEKRLELVHEIKRVTNDRAVVRTDCGKEDFRSFNLPRTDTVTAEAAVDWCEKTLNALQTEGVEPSDVMFLIHAFLPALASAWAYARKGSPTVIVDALWGLPDGMQVLPVDTYEVVVPQEKIIDTRSVHKTRFLSERDDGNWAYVSVLRSKGRSKVLKPKDILEIAKRTHRIADKLGSDAQIMWFCGIPVGYGVGRNLPWFRSREQFDTAPRVDAKFKEVDVTCYADLDKLTERQATIKLMPDANLIRDDVFLEKVIETAKQRRLPVKLEGSMLAHIYYRLCEAGVGVVVENRAKYSRKRGKREFGKIVRDKIPTNIAYGGEEVVEAILERDDALHGLSAKVVEELEEFINAVGGEDRLAEMADVYEVVRGLAANANLDWDEVEAAAKQKREKRGGFLDRKVLIETSLARPATTDSGQAVVSLDTLSKPQNTKDGFSVPLMAIMNSIGRASVNLSSLGGCLSFSMQIKDGNLIIKKISSSESGPEIIQTNLFDSEK